MCPDCRASGLRRRSGDSASSPWGRTSRCGSGLRPPVSDGYLTAQAVTTGTGLKPCSPQRNGSVPEQAYAGSLEWSRPEWALSTVRACRWLRRPSARPPWFCRRRRLRRDSDSEQRSASMPTVVHFDITTDDLQSARAFYESLFNWKLTFPPGMPDFYLFETRDLEGNRVVGGDLCRHGRRRFWFVAGR